MRYCRIRRETHAVPYEAVSCRRLLRHHVASVYDNNAAMFNEVQVTRIALRLSTVCRPAASRHAANAAAGPGGAVAPSTAAWGCTWGGVGKGGRGR